MPLALRRRGPGLLRFFFRAAIRPPFWNRPAGHAVAVRNAFRALGFSALVGPKRIASVREAHRKGKQNAQDEDQIGRQEAV
jgi:hypothetical protein